MCVLTVDCALQHATALRATEATGVHSQSSRSHAVCRIYIRSGSSSSTDVNSGTCYDDSATNEQLEGVLTLVDLAGSEMRIDSDKHDAGESSHCTISATNRQHHLQC
jgi:Kinesin motor domain